MSLFQERAQMEAFHVLQLQTDDKHQRITNQVSTLPKLLVHCVNRMNFA